MKTGEFVFVVAGVYGGENRFSEKGSNVDNIPKQDQP